MKLQCADRILDLSTPKVMGVLNTTPDSFSDGGRFSKLDSALLHAESMVLDGATIIDVGGESTRPGAQKVSLDEELSRVIPVVEAISSRLDVCISVDSSSPRVMVEAKKAGAHILNDVRALTREGALEAAVESQLPVCIMHMRGEPDTMQDNPQYAQVVQDVVGYLQQRIQGCLDAGIAQNQLLVDPGFGFGKTLTHNYQLLAQLDAFAQLDVPLLIGLSRKSMIGGVLADSQGNPRSVEQRVAGSVAGAVIAAMKGAHIIRVHDVKDTVDALKVVQATKEQER
jgi:dihydropteroate synthase